MVIYKFSYRFTELPYLSYQGRSLYICSSLTVWLFLIEIKRACLLLSHIKKSMKETSD